jgi:putative hemolysin
MENAMKNTLPVIAALLLLGTLFSACTPAATPALAPAPTSTSAAAGIANPASVYCSEHGGKLDIITAADGSQTANCTLPDKTVCEEWAYFRGECGAAQSTPQANAPYPAGGSDQAAGKVSQLAVQKLAGDLKIDAATIQVVSKEATTWPDSCLGVTAAGEVCAQMLTDGFKIVLSAGDKQYTLHTNADGSVIRTEK